MVCLKMMTDGWDLIVCLCRTVDSVDERSKEKKWLVPLLVVVVRRVKNGNNLFHGLLLLLLYNMYTHINLLHEQDTEKARQKRLKQKVLNPHTNKRSHYLPTTDQMPRLQLLASLLRY